MTSLLERSIRFIAPHRCLICSKEDNVICADCLDGQNAVPTIPCFLCGAMAKGLAFCQKCVPAQSAPHMWVAATYDGVIAEVIHMLKFGRAAAAVQPPARLLATRITHLPPTTLLVPVPTAAPRIRQRGYDHCMLLTKELARQTGLAYAPLIQRNHNKRQVGADRAERLHQANRAFTVMQNLDPTRQNILLVDDVITTGATVLNAAAALRQAGARHVDIAAVAYRPGRSWYNNPVIRRGDRVV